MTICALPDCYDHHDGIAERLQNALNKAYADRAKHPPQDIGWHDRQSEYIARLNAALKLSARYTSLGIALYQALDAIDDLARAETAAAAEHAISLLPSGERAMPALR